MFDRQLTEQLKGVAILLVVLGHLFVTKFFNTSIHAVNYLGAQGVAIFLILSGYGLTQSFFIKGMDRTFLLRRVKTVLLPYSLVTLVWVVLDYFYGKAHSLKIVGLSLLGFDFQLTFDATMWYISFILMWYLIFYVTFRLSIPNLLRVIILFGFAYIFRYHSRDPLTEQVYWQWGLHAFMFPIGVVWALIASKFELRSWMLYPMMGIGVLSLIFYVFNVKNNDSGLGPYMLSNFSFAVAIMALFLVFRSLDANLRVLRFVGSISYEIYLLEAVLMYKYSLLYLLPNKGLSLGIYAAGLVVLSLGIQRMMRFNLGTKVKQGDRSLVSRG